MLVGVVSDTHNNIKSVKAIIDIFNKEEVDYVIHTGDISKASTLQMFSNLNCKFLGVFGNNDRNEIGLEEVCEEFNFNFQEPPFLDLDETQFPTVDIVVSARDEEAVVGRLVQRLLDVRYPQKKINICIIDDGSQDNTPLILEGFNKRLTNLKD